MRIVLGVILIAVGVALVIVSGLADVVGLNKSETSDDEFGYKQIIGLVVGLVLAAAGLVMALRRGRGAADSV